MVCVIYASYGLAVWCRSKLILEKGYDGGKVIVVMFNLLTDGMKALMTIKFANNVYHPRIQEWRCLFLASMCLFRKQILNCFACWTRSLGQASPSMNAPAAGQAVAYKMFETIKRKPRIDAYDMNGMIRKRCTVKLNLEMYTSDTLPGLTFRLSLDFHGKFLVVQLQL